MSGHKPFSELTKNFSPQRKAKIEALTNKLREEMTLQELRAALDIPQLEHEKQHRTDHDLDMHEI